MTPGYEKSLNVASWFFTLLVGLSLTHVLGQDRPSPSTPFFVNRGLLFIIGGLLFLRYLTGSAVHLWYEYLRPGRNLDKNAFKRDFYFLLVFGFLGVFAFYQNTVENFLVGTIILVGSALVWGVRNWWNNRDSPWNYWIVINGMQIVSLLAALFFHINYPESLEILQISGFMPEVLNWLPNLSVWLTIVVLIFVVCLVVDIRMQIRIIESISTGDDRDDGTGVNGHVRQIRANVTAIEKQLASIASEVVKIQKDLTVIERKANDMRERVAAIHDNGA